MKNICIVGCGNIGRLHSKNLSGFSNLYFYSRSKSSAEKFNNEFNGGGVFNNFEEILETPEIDAVVISSPPEFHKAQIIQTLQAGKPVLVEKPMCISEDEINEIEKVLKTTQNVFLMVAENYYYKPSLKKIKKLIDKGYIGKIKSVFVKKVFEQLANGWKSKHGSLLEGGIHFVALISGIFDDIPGKIEAHFPNGQKDEPERHSITKLFYNESFAELVYSWNTKSLTKGLFQHSQIIGENGKITFESNGIYIYLNADSKKRFYMPDLSDILGFKAMIKDFLTCLNDKTKKPYSDFHKAQRDLNIVFQAYQNKI